MGFKGFVPPKQPRTARSNAERKGTTPSGFLPDIPYSAQAGAPLDVVGASSSYRDESAPSKEANGPSRADNKAPFVVTRRG